MTVTHLIVERLRGLAAADEKRSVTASGSLKEHWSTRAEAFRESAAEVERLAASALHGTSALPREVAERIAEEGLRTSVEYAHEQGCAAHVMEYHSGECNKGCIQRVAQSIVEDHLGPSETAKDKRTEPPEHDAFMRGYAVAVGIVVSGWNEESLAASVVKEGGFYYEDFVDAGVDEHDLSLLRAAGVRKRAAR